jgi:hypothetical protein
MMKEQWAGEAVECTIGVGTFNTLPTVSIFTFSAERLLLWVLFGFFNYISDENLEIGEKRFRSAN